MRSVPKNTGHTLLEMTFSMGLLGLVLGMIGLVSTQGSRGYSLTSIDSLLVQKGRRALSAVTEHLVLAEAADVNVLPASPSWSADLAFDRLGDVSAVDGSITWSPTRLSLEYAPGELDDGVDNDGDGLVDECVVVLITDDGGPTEFERVLVSSVAEYLEGEVPNGNDDNGNGLVDERGLSFERVGSVLTIHLTLQRANVEGRVVSQTIRTAVRVRN